VLAAWWVSSSASLTIDNFVLLRRGPSSERLAQPLVQAYHVAAAVFYTRCLEVHAPNGAVCRAWCSLLMQEFYDSRVLLRFLEMLRLQDCLLVLQSSFCYRSMQSETAVFSQSLLLLGRVLMLDRKPLGAAVWRCIEPSFPQ